MLVTQPGALYLEDTFRYSERDLLYVHVSVTLKLKHGYWNKSAAALLQLLQLLLSFITEDNEPPHQKIHLKSTERQRQWRSERRWVQQVFSCLDHRIPPRSRLMLFHLLSMHRWTERDQTGHLQPPLWATRKGEPWQGDAGKAHQAIGRSRACSAERIAEEWTNYTFLKNVNIRDIFTGRCTSVRATL